MTADREGNALVPGSTYLAAGICKADEGADSVLMLFGNGKHAMRLTGASLLPIASCILSSGAVPFLGPVAGVAPTIGAHLTTKDYVDFQVYSLGISIAALAASSYQPKNQILTNLSTFLPSTADRFVYFTDTVGGQALATVTPFARTLLDDSTAADAIATLGAATLSTETWHYRLWDCDGNPAGDWLNGSTGTGGGAGQGTDHVNTTENVEGEWVIAAGTTASSRGSIYLYLTGIMLGDGTARFLEWRATIGALSTAADEYVIHWGFIDNANANAEPTNGCYFRYLRTTDGDFIACVTSDNGARTVTVTAVSPADYSTMHVWSIEVNAAATSVVFKRDGATLATHAANIPTTAGRRTGVGFKAYRTAYTAVGRWTYFDWIRYRKTRTAAR